jgi:hypothetical protein
MSAVCVCGAFSPKAADLHLAAHKANCIWFGKQDIPAIERRPKSARLEEFDRETATITLRRGEVYGPPREDFERVQAIYAAQIGDQGDADLDPAVRHVFYMMAVKLARLRRSPAHLDSWIDINGYARTGVMVTDDLLPGGARYGCR